MIIRSRSDILKKLNRDIDKSESMEDRKMGRKIMLLGIAVILAGIALSISNILAFGGGVAGLLIVIIGMFIRDNDTKH